MRKNLSEGWKVGLLGEIVCSHLHMEIHVFMKNPGDLDSGIIEAIGEVMMLNPEEAASRCQIIPRLASGEKGVFQNLISRPIKFGLINFELVASPSLQGVSVNGDNVLIGEEGALESVHLCLQETCSLFFFSSTLRLASAARLSMDRVEK